MNPFLKKMGYTEDDRVLITHVDDMGFCHAANVASLACLQGSASCASIIVNAPWFREAVAMCEKYGPLDIGVHLTLTSEYGHYRWPPMSTRDASSGLMDAEGYLWHSVRDAVKHIPASIAEAEMRAQIDTALASGLPITHIDAHMGTVVHPRYIRSYLSLAREYAIPAFLPYLAKERLEQMRQVDDTDTMLAALEEVDRAEVPTLDEILIDTLVPMTDKSQFYRDLIGAIKPGLTHLLFHPAVDGDELSAITGTHASRNADYLVWQGPVLRNYIADAGIHLIGYRELQTAMET